MPITHRERGDGMAGTQSISGLISGLDTQAIIEKLISIEKIPQNIIKQRQAEITQQINGWSTFEAMLIGLKTNVSSLGSQAQWGNFSVASSKADVLSATGSETAQAGTYTIGVEQIAMNHQLAFGEYTSLTQSIGNGTLSVTIDGKEHTVDISGTANTVQGFVTAVNSANVGVKASLLNMNGHYKIVLASEKTGLENAMIAKFTPTNGVAAGFDTLSVNNDGWTGAAVSASGVFTGYEDTSYTLTAQNSGTIGTDEITFSWTSGTRSGEITLPSDYNGSAITLADGITLTFASNGAVTEDESFTVDVDAASIQKPQDAHITFGSGANALNIYSATNDIQGVIPGVTINALSALPGTPITLTVNRDTESIVNKVQAMVQSYNKIIDFTNQQQKYDQETQTSGILFGDSTFRSVDMNLKAKFSGYLSEVRGQFRAFADIGITMNDDATLSLNSTELTNALRNNYADVEKLFLNTGETDDEDIKYFSATSATKVSVGGYDVVITRAAQQAQYNGASRTISSSTPLVVSSSNNALQLVVDGVRLSNTIIPSGTYTSGEALATAMQDAINTDELLQEKTINVEWVETAPGQGYFQITSPTYGSRSEITIESSSANVSLGLTNATRTGVDVAGTINGEAAEGMGRLLKGKTGNATTDGLALEVTLTAAELTSQGEAQGKAYYTTGLMSSIDTFMEDLTNTLSGVLATQKKSLKTMYDDMQIQIKKYDEKIEAKRLELEIKYNQLETILNKLNSQGSYLSAQISGLSNLSGTSN